jgi:hypothetical protein
MKLSGYSWAGYGFAVTTIYGVSKHGWGDYRVMGLFYGWWDRIKAVFLL